MLQNHPLYFHAGPLALSCPPRLRLFSVITNPPLITIARFHKIIQGKGEKNSLEYDEISNTDFISNYGWFRVAASNRRNSEKKGFFSTRTTVVLLRKAGFEQFNCRVFRLYKNRFNLASLIHRFKTSLLENFPSSTISLRAVLRHQPLSCLEAHPVN